MIGQKIISKFINLGVGVGRKKMMTLSKVGETIDLLP